MCSYIHQLLRCPHCVTSAFLQEAYFCTPRYLPTSLGTFPGSRGNLLPLRTLPRPTYIGQARLGPVWGYPSQTPSWVSRRLPHPTPTRVPRGYPVWGGLGDGLGGVRQGPGPQQWIGGWGGGYPPPPRLGYPKPAPPRPRFGGSGGGPGGGPWGPPNRPPQEPPPTPPHPQLWGF